MPSLAPTPRRIAATLGVTLAIALLWWASSSSTDKAPSEPTAAQPPARVGGEAPEAGSLLQEGTQIFLRDRSTRTCTVGAVLPHRRILTAGHCGPVGAEVSLHSDSEPIGAVTAVYPRNDLAVIEVAPSVPVGELSTLAPVPAPGFEVAAHGATTGRLTGTVVTPRQSLTLPSSQQMITVAIASFCAAPGDSGSPVYRTGTSAIIGLVIAIDDTASGCRTFVAPAELLP